MKVIGLAGNIASGKSAISSFLNSLGAEIIDMDKVGKQIQEDNYDGVRDKIALCFGANFVVNNKIDRKALAKTIFNKPENMMMLNKIMFPLMTDKLVYLIDHFRKMNTPVVIVDAATLFEAGWDKLVDEVWVVYVPKSVQLKRLLNREQINETEALTIINSQMDISEKIRRADTVINNERDFEKVKGLVLELWKKIISSI